MASGRSSEALLLFQDGLKISLSLAKADTTNTQKKRDLSFSLDRLGNVLLTLGRSEDALTQFQDELKISLAVAEADADDNENRRALSVSFCNLGKVFERLGRNDDALFQFQEASKIRHLLAEADLNNAQKQSHLSELLNRLGDLLLKLGRVDEAVAQYEEMLKINQTLADADPDNVQKQRGLMVAYHRLAEVDAKELRFDNAIGKLVAGIAALDRMIEKGQSSEAAKKERAVLQQRIQFWKVAQLVFGDWDALLMVDAKVLPQLLILRATEMLKRGELAKAVQAADKLRDMTPKDKNNLYNAACVYARCATFTTKDKPNPTDAEKAERQKFVNLSLECLKESLAAGWSDFDHLRKDEDLAPLRGLPEFEALFPERPKQD